MTDLFESLPELIAESLAATCEHCVVPIFVLQSERFAQHGTGTLLKVGNRSFVLTASHVLNNAEEYDLLLFVSDSAVGARFQRLSGRQSFVREHRFDVGLVELEPQQLEFLPNRRFLCLADLDFHGPCTVVTGVVLEIVDDKIFVPALVR